AVWVARVVAVVVVVPVRWLWREVVVRGVRALGAGLWWLVRLFGAALVWAFRFVGRGLAALGRAVRSAVTWVWHRVVRPVLAPVGRFVRQVWRTAVVAPARWVGTSVIAPVRLAGRRLRGQLRGAFGGRRD
ncbi:MAG: hypothetical protein HOV94_10050, partial [Saccharothrix sp.]|nr:hypothetical protein [Saccharothrix sp.]